MTDQPQFKRIVLSREGRTAMLALASDKVNAMDREVFEEIAAAVDFCEQDPDIGAIVLTGEGKFFSAGVNVNEILANEKSYTDRVLDALVDALGRLFRTPLPTVAAVNGSAIAGGCLMACACDKRLMATGARIGVTELRVGVSFPVLAVEVLKHVSGPRAEQLIFDAELLDADQACLYGLAHEQRPLFELRATALAAAEQLASLDARAYGLAKAAARRAALSASEDESGRLLDTQVRRQWQEDATRASLQKLLAPKS